VKAEAPPGTSDGSAGRAAARPVVPVVAWAVVAALVCGAMAPLEPNLLEEGLLLHLAQRLVGGEHLFVDLASFTGPFPFELLALLFRLFGDDIAVARAAVAVFSGVACAAVFALARRARIGDGAHVAAAVVASGPVFLFPLHSSFFYSTIAYQLTLMTAYAGLRGRESDGWAVAAGAGAACVALTKQSVGLLLAVLLVLALAGCSPVARRRRAAGIAVLGGAAVAVLTLGYYGSVGALGAMVDSLVFLPLGFDDAFASPFINLWPPGEFAPELLGQAHFYTPFVYSMLRGVVLQAPSFSMTLGTQALYALPFVALAATGLRRLAGPLPPGLWFHAVALVALIANLFPRTDWGQLVFCAAPALVQLVLLVPGRVGRASGVPRAFAWLVVAGLAAGALTVGAGLWRKSQPAELGPRISLRALGGQSSDPALGRVIAYLDRRAEPGEAIFVARSEPLVYFATNTRNPTPYSGVIPGMFDAQEATILAALEDVRFVVMSEIDQPVFTVYRELLPAVADHLERHFQLPSEFQGRGYGWIVVYERSIDRGATVVDLMERRGEATPWVRGIRGVMHPAGEGLPFLATSQNRRPMPMWIASGGGGIDFDLEVPGGGVFQADVGLAAIYGGHPGHPRRVTFSLAVATGGGEFTTLASQPVLRGPSDGGRWTPFEVDLSEYAGQRIALRLEVTPAAPLGRMAIAWWGSPRLISR
jgi:hypothetical protein